jgi:RNA polymerase sigma factor (sigma-70 family)
MDPWFGAHSDASGSTSRASTTPCRTCSWSWCDGSPPSSANRSLTNWLWGIARGVASTHRRTRRRQDRLHAGLATAAEARESSPDDGIDLARARAILEEFLATLDEDKCAVFVLAEIEGQTGPEIASRLDVNLNTVYARLRCARRLWAQTLDARRRPLGVRALVPAWLPISKASSAASAAWIPSLLGSTLAATLVLPVAMVEPAPIHAEIHAEVHAEVHADVHADVRDVGAAAVEGVRSTHASRSTRTRPEAAKESIESARPADEEIDPMRIPAATALAAITLAATPVDAKPKRASNPWVVVPTSDQDADEAARVGGSDVDREYIFEEDEVDGERLGPDGRILLQPPSPRFQSLIDIRGHFNPELMRLASDV